MAKEFQESEVIFQENAGDGDIDHEYCTGGHSDSRELRNNNNNKIKRQKKKKKKKRRNSVPINVPENLSRNSWFQYEDHSDLLDDEYGGITPPHVILGRRIAGKMAFSVCTGNGRTLKGRDLSQVRNSILRMTGFLET